MNDSSSNLGPSNQQPILTNEPSSPQANKWTSVAFESLLPACVLVPLFIVFGAHAGWGTLILIFYIAPIAFFFHIGACIMAHFGSRKRHLGRYATVALAVYYASLVLSVLAFLNGGDTAESVGSRLTDLGIPRAVSDGVSMFAGYASIASMVALVVFLVQDIVKARLLKHNQGTSHEPTVTI